MEQARRLGPLPYSAAGGDPAPDLPPAADLAGALAELVDRLWYDLGRPDPCTLVEAGAGDGTRMRALLEIGPECLTALRCVLVEHDPALRHHHPALLSIEAPALVLGPVGRPGRDDADDEAEQDGGGIGPLVTSLGDLPVVEGPAIVVAVGYASALASDRLEWRDGRWGEIRLAAAPGSEHLREVAVPLDGPRAAAADALVDRDRDGVAPTEGARVAVQRAAVEWLTQALRVAEDGWLAVIDRWSPVTTPLPPGEVPPLALDQLASVRKPLQAAPAAFFPPFSLVLWRLA